MSEKAEQLIISTIERNHQDFIREIADVKKLIEKEATQRSKMFSDWGDRVLEQGSSITDIQVWKAGHMEQMNFLTISLDQITNDIRTIKSDVETIGRWKTQLKTKITVYASVASVALSMLITFALDFFSI
jgi:UDP-N-acetylmuramate-alanine ligase